MNEEVIRAIVRETLARRLGAPFDGLRAAASMPPDPDVPLQPLTFAGHGSHYRYTVPKTGSACVIEPGVQCNHCGYCESHGH